MISTKRIRTSARAEFVAAQFREQLEKEDGHVGFEASSDPSVSAANHTISSERSQRRSAKLQQLQQVIDMSKRSSSDRAVVLIVRASLAIQPGAAGRPGKRRKARSAASANNRSSLQLYVEAEGIEAATSDSTSITTLANHTNGSAASGAPFISQPELQEIVDAWASLTPTDQAAVLTLVRALKKGA